MKNIYVKADNLSSEKLKAAQSKLEEASKKLGSLNKTPVYNSITGRANLYTDSICAEVIRIKIAIDALRGNIATYARLIDDGPQSLVTIDAAYKNDLVNDWSRLGFFLSKGWRNTSDWATELFTDLFGISKRRTGGEVIVDSSIELYTNGTETTIQTKVFDENGSYGGDQGGPYAESDPQKREKYYALIRQNRDEHSWTEEKLEKYLQEIEAMGCVYTAYANIIMQHFEKDPVLFEEVFGYPMFTDEGEFDFNTLIVDICSSQEETVDGVNWYEMQFNLDDYLEGHNLPVVNDTHFFVQYGGLGELDKVVTPDTFETVVAEGNHIIVHACGSYLKGTDGTSVGPIGDHGMIVTGVTEDGRYVVSSWGRKYYLSPDSGTQRFWTVSFE